MTSVTNEDIQTQRSYVTCPRLKQLVIYNILFLLFYQSRRWSREWFLRLICVHISCSSHLHIIAIQGSISLVSLGLLNRTWASLHFDFLCHLPHLSLCTQPFFQAPGESVTRSGLLQGILIPLEEGSQEMKSMVMVAFRKWVVVETSWRVKWQHQKGKWNFPEAQAGVLPSYWLECASVFNPVISLEEACMLGFHLVSLKAYSFLFIFPFFAGLFLFTKSWVTSQQTRRQVKFKKELNIFQGTLFTFQPIY